MPLGDQKCWVFVCLSVMLLDNKVYENDLPRRLWNLEVFLLLLDNGRFVSMQLGDATRGCQSWKCGNIWGFSPFKGDRIHPLEIWQVSVHHRPASVCHIRSWSFRGWAQEPSSLNFTLLGQLVSTMYSTAAAWNSSLLKIRLQVSSFMWNFTFWGI